MNFNCYLSCVFIVLFVYNTQPCLAEDTIGENKSNEVVIEIFSKGRWPQRIRASIYIYEETQKIWQLLTDYDHLADYIPDLLSSRLIKQEDDTVIIEQKNKARILFFHKTLFQKISVKHEYPERLIFKGIKGDMDIYEGKWILKKINNKSTLLTYDLKVKPNFYVPQWLFRYKLKKTISKSLNAIRNHITNKNENINDKN